MSTGFTTVSAQHLQDATGTAITNATISFLPVSNAGAPISFRTGGTQGQTISQAVSVDVVAGAFSIQLADTSQTAPLNVGYRVTVTDQAGHVLLAKGYECIQPTGANWSLDAFVPNFAAQLTVQSGPEGQGYRARGAWAPDTDYEPYDNYQQGGSTFVVDTAYTSASTFGALDAANISLFASGTLTQQQILQLSSLGYQVTIGPTNLADATHAPNPGLGYTIAPPVPYTGPFTLSIESSIATSATIQIQQSNGDGTLTAVSSQNVSLVPGTNTFSLSATAGQYVGFWSAANPFSFVTGTSTDMWFTQGIVGTSTPYQVYQSVTLQASIFQESGLFSSIASNATQLAALAAGANSASASITSLQSAVAATTSQLTMLGAPATVGVPVVAGTISFNPFSFINSNSISPSPGTIRNFEMFAPGAGSAILFTAQKNTDGSYTPLATAAVNVPAAGLNTFNIVLPVAAGNYVGLYTSMGFAASEVTGVDVAFFGGAPVVGTPGSGGGVISGKPVPYSFTVTSGLIDQLVAGETAAGATGAGIGLLIGADNTGATDATSYFTAASAAHPAPYVPPGTFSLTSIPRHGQGFWGDGILFVNGVRYPIWRSPHDGSLQLAHRSALALQASTGSPVILLGDSLFAGTGATAEAYAWGNLYANFINFGYASGPMLPVVTYLHDGTDNGTNQPGSFYGLTQVNTTANAYGPISASTAINPGGSISFTGPYAQLGFFYNQTAGATVTVTSGNTTLKTLDASAAPNGDSGLDLYSGVINTNQTGSATYTISVSGAPVTITGIVRENTTSLVTGYNAIHTIRAAHGGFAVTNFQTAQLVSVLKQAAALGGGTTPEVIIDLITNDQAAGPGGLAAYVTGLNRIITYLQGQGAVVKYVLPQDPSNNSNYILYSGALQTVCRQLGVPLWRSDTLNFAENPGLFYTDGLHWSNAGNAKVFEGYTRWRAEQP